MLKGGAVLVMLRMSIRAIGLVSIVILFRVLNPADFGIVALAMLVVGFVEVFAEFGFDQVLLRNPNAVRADYDVAWTLNLIRGVAVAALLLAIAPFAAAFLEEPRLTPVVLVLALVPLLDGLQNIGTVDFSKNLEFHKEFKLKVTQKLVSFVVTLVAAFVLRNYWALVLGVISGRLAGMALGYALHPYRPRLTLEGWRGMMRFSIWILANNVVLYVGNQTDKVVIQRNFSAHTVGIVRVAEEISGMVMELVWPVEKALYAGYVKVAHDVERLRRTMLVSVGLVAMVGVPLSLGLGALAEPAINVVLGAKGHDAIAFVQVYVLHGAIRSCLCGVFPIFMVLGRPEVMAQVTLVTVVVRLTVLLLGFPLIGLAAVPWSMVASTATAFLLVWWRVSLQLRLGAFDLPAAVWRCVVASAAMAAAGWWMSNAMPADLGDFVRLMLLVPLCTAIYIGVLGMLWMLCGRPDGPERTALSAGCAWLHKRFPRSSAV